MENKYIENDDMSLKELIEKAKEWYIFLLSQWKTIILAGIIGGTLGLTYAFMKKPVYTATLSFALEDDKSGGGSLGSALGLAGSLGLDLGGGGGSIFTGSNLTELFKSRRMVEETLLTQVNYNQKEVTLAEMYIDINKLRKGWEENKKLVHINFPLNLKRENFTRIHDSILGSIYKQLSKSSLLVAQKDKKISIINIDMSSTDELFAKYFCEALAKQVGKFYIDTKSKKARINMGILSRQVDSIRKELNGAISGVAIANDNTFNLNPALNVRRSPMARRQVDVQANTAILTELVKQSELAKVTLRKETPLIQVIDRPILPLPKEGFGRAKGLILGGVLFSFLAAFFLVIKKIFNDLL
ncbi:Wzz/FepE/Etk N-terminal domain-containing protein [Flavobacterium hercynium]|uniref:Lipopolysaccharide biosynthesis protein n=1 Tax=Flavobacterium hercynium TaxID=387094 RepID=A0A226HEU6_9FLAO|nr:Wzz/FepE/Etk N-terminal domain-containing protein [Flavobacterium hercynium]OXA92176.1 lipopolysaccharide biosynthesis protein [Flavobacterium hercynium]SMP24572.1 Chain length determinant protein [Flavobacterium hercynium]